MKFIFADSQDYVDPGFDFENEAYSPDRRVQHDDVYPHEFFEYAPYDGMLVSRATVGDGSIKGKYTTAQSLRFRRDGAREFLRYWPEANGGMLFGDCGAFSYVREEKPPYNIPEMVDYYAACGFTHAVSIDHVVLGYNENFDAPSLFGGCANPVEHHNVPEDWKYRYKLTLQLAEEFLNYCEANHVPFQPLGIAQGWSPLSYQEAVRRLVDMGYDYIALGGLVPLMAPQIRRILDAVRDIAPNVRIHLFGFTKADELHQFVPYNLASFDSTSPLLRAFKDDKKNYFDGGRWYTAIRLPNADENNRFKKDILAGVKAQKVLRVLEQKAIMALRAYAAHQATLEEALAPIVEYGVEFHGDKVPVQAYRETLQARPWDSCDCKVCRESGVEVIIFRGSNRNRRRGFHNLWTFYQHLLTLRPADDISPIQLNNTVRTAQHALQVTNI